MKKLSLYVFLGLLWCNSLYAVRYSEFNDSLGSSGSGGDSLLALLIVLVPFGLLVAYDMYKENKKFERMSMPPPYFPEKRVRTRKKKKKKIR